MWVLTSLGRPERIRQVVDSYDWRDAQVLLVLYDKDAHLQAYLDQKWPDTWKIETVSILGNGPTYNEILKRYPDEPFYGFLADDAILDQQGMLKELEKASDGWYIAYPNDQHHGANIPTMPCIGGDLVRAIGYLAPPGLMHMAIDCAWYDIGRKIGALRYFNHLTYTHLNPVWGTAPDDRTYQLAKHRSVDYDRLYRSWMMGELNQTVLRIRQAQLRRSA